MAMRERGFRQIQMFARVSTYNAVAAADRAGDDQDFIEQISEDWPG